MSMATGQQAVSNGTAPSLIEQLGKAFLELEAHKNATDNKVPWIEIEEHFRNLETLWKLKSSELEAKEKEYEQKKAETRVLITEREAVVFAKEQNFLDWLQELKDAAVSVIADERANHHTTLEITDGADGEDTKVNDPISPGDFFPHNLGEIAEGVVGDVDPRPEIMQFCQQMNAKGLLNIATQNIKDIYAIRDELSVALESATEPARLVLESLEGFYPPTQSEDKKDTALLLGLRKSCVMFLEAFSAFLAKNIHNVDSLLNPEHMHQAKAIADEWKPKLASAGIDAANANSLELEAFLQLLATYRIASLFDVDELCKLVLAVAHRRQAPELCRNLGLTHKMPEIVETLVNGEKEIEGVRLIHAFQLTETFPPVPILKTYLRELRRNSQGNGEHYGDGATAPAVNAQELAALRAVIWCIKEYKLEVEYPLEPLEKRVIQLERSKTDKFKRSGHFVVKSRPQKRSRLERPERFRRFRGPDSGGGGAPGRLPTPVYGERLAYAGVSDRYSHSNPNPYNYQAQPSYAPPPNDQRMYYYSQDDRVQAAAAPYNGAPPNYSSYQPLQQQPYM